MVMAKAVLVLLWNWFHVFNYFARSFYLTMIP